MYTTARKGKKSGPSAKVIGSLQCFILSVLLGYGHGLQWSQLQDGYATVIYQILSVLYIYLVILTALIETTLQMLHLFTRPSALTATNLATL